MPRLAGYWLRPCTLVPLWFSIIYLCTVLGTTPREEPWERGCSKVTARVDGGLLQIID